MITVQQLTKKYARHTAVDHISFSVEKGQIVGFLGPNGAGKTTTMRMLTCFLPPTSGTAVVAGFDVLAQPLEVKRRIGYLPEMPPLYLEMRTAEYLTFVGRLKGLRGPALAERVEYVLGRCAVAGDHTIILSTHILPEVEQTCEQVIIINRGRVVATDSVSNLQNRARGIGSVLVGVAARTGTLDSAAVRRRLEVVPGVSRVALRESRDSQFTFEVESKQDRAIRAELARAVVESGWDLNELRSAAVSLEEVFLQLTASEAAPARAAAPSREAEAVAARN